MSEVEIGPGKRAKSAYSFDDIAIVPTRRTRDVEEVSLKDRKSTRLNSSH